jgi:hypothetical protein
MSAVYEDEDPYTEGEEDASGIASGNDDDNEEELEEVLHFRPKETWNSGGAKKNEVVRELIKCFGSMVESRPKEYALPDHTGRYKPADMVFEKLLDAAKYVAKAKRYARHNYLNVRLFNLKCLRFFAVFVRALILNENFDTRDFTIFIANKQWIKNILRPLLELCAKDDRYNILTFRYVHLWTLNTNCV